MIKRDLKKMVVLIIVLSILLSGCSGGKHAQKTRLIDGELDLYKNADVSVNIAALKGPTTIGIIKMVNKYDELFGETKSTFKMYETADEVVVGLSKGDIDIAAIPANLAATLYNKTDGKIKVAAINTLGVLYLLENGESIEKPEDLNGKTIYTIGKGTTPEGVLKSFIEGHNLRDINIEYRNEATEIMAMLKTEEDIIAMLPEPFVTVAEQNNEDIRVLFNMNKEWIGLHDGDLLVTGVLAVRKEFLDNHKAIFDEFLEAYERSIKYTMTNVEETAKLAERAEIIPPGIGEIAIPRSNIVYIDGDDMKKHLEKYLTILHAFNEKLVGGSLPDEDFYYKK